MKKKILILTLVLALMTACNNNRNNATEGTTEQAVVESTELQGETTEAPVTSLKEDSYGFMMNGKGVIVTPIENSGKKVVDVYIDPSCPSCLISEEILKLEGEQALGENGIFNYHPVAFLGPEDIETHSQKATAYMHAVRDVSPEIFKDFFFEVMTVKFAQPLVTLPNDEAFKKLYEDLGGDKWDTVESLKPAYVQLIKQKTEEFLMNEELAAKSPGESLFVPYFVVEGQEKALDVNLETLVEDLNTQINK